jgi:glutamate 5-kinase
MTNGKSLLPAGVTRVEGNFARGDCVVIRNAQGGEIGRGLVAYDASEAVLIAGRNSQDIESLLGAPGRAAIIHRDDMVVAGE